MRAFPSPIEGYDQLYVAGIDPFAAADNYRRADELFRKARAELVTSAAANAAELNIRALSRRAGLHESTLRIWIAKGEVSPNGGKPATAPN